MDTGRAQDPALPDFEEGMLPVGGGTDADGVPQAAHEIYWCAYGNRAAPTVLVVHGGPGGAMNLQWGKFFDPTRWRIVFFDQRGCGRSMPFGSTQDNTLAALVSDIDALRAALGCPRWALFGGSWGTTLALAYGIAHPERCTGFLLRGIFLARKADIDWFLWDVRRVFPEAHEAFLDAIERADGRRPVNHEQILAYAAAPLARSDTQGVALARAWSRFEATLSSVQGMPEVAAKTGDPAGASAGAPAAPPSPPPPPSPDAQRRAVSMALLEHHYMAHELPAPDFLGRLGALQDHPCYIVHGRFDMVCPAEQASALKFAWPSAHLDIVPASGHWTFEPGIEKALFKASAALLQTLSN